MLELQRFPDPSQSALGSLGILDGGSALGSADDSRWYFVRIKAKPRLLVLWLNNLLK